MQRRCKLTHLILAGVVVLSLAPMMVAVDAQAQIAFVSNRDGKSEIYVMAADGWNPQNLSNNPDGNYGPAWYTLPLVVAPAGKTLTTWGWLKQADR